MRDGAISLSDSYGHASCSCPVLYGGPTAGDTMATCLVAMAAITNGVRAGWWQLTGSSTLGSVLHKVFIDGLETGCEHILSLLTMLHWEELIVSRRAGKTSGEIITNKGQGHHQLHEV